MLMYVRDGWRRWSRTPAATVVALLSLTLAMGANAGIFSVLDALLLKSLPLPNPDQLVNVREQGRDHRNSRISLAVWERVSAHQNVFSGVAAYAPQSVDISRPGEPTNSVDALIVSNTYFGVLGVVPRLGRLFTPDAQSGDAENVAVLSEHAWRSTFGADPSILGRTILINRQPFTIVGVTGGGFFGTEPGRSFDVAIPISAYPVVSQAASASTFASRNQWLHLIGRLDGGVSLTIAESMLQALQASIRQSTSPSAEAIGSHLRLLWELEPTGETMSGRRATLRWPMWALSIIAVLILLIACANIAALQLARASARRGEFAARLALGSTRLHVFWQLVFESVLITAVAAAAGTAISYAVRAGLIRLLSTDTVPIHLDTRFGWRVAMFTVVAVFLSTVITAAAPAWQMMRVDPAVNLRGFRDIGRRRQFGTLQVILVAQVALTFVLLFAAAALVQTFRALTGQHYGFEPAGIFNVAVELRQSGVENSQRRALADALRAKLAEVGDVEDAAFVLSAPFGTASFLAQADVPGRELGSESDRRIQYNYVSEQYFQLMGIPIKAGSVHRAHDGPYVAVVSEAFVRRFMVDRAAVGRTFTLSEGVGEFQVLGVVGDVKVSSLREPPPPMVYLPWQPQTRTFSTLRFVVRRSGEAAEFERRIVSAVEELVTGVTARATALDAEIDATLVTERAVAVLSVAFASLAVLLAAVGLYGTMTYVVSCRTPEIALRAILGADPRRVRAVVVNQMSGVVLLGIAVGVIASAWAGKQLESFLFGVRPLDGFLFVIAALVTASAAIFAGYLPARRATRVNAIQAMRTLP